MKLFHKIDRFLQPKCDGCGVMSNVLHSDGVCCLYCTKCTLFNARYDKWLRVVNIWLKREVIILNGDYIDSTTWSSK